jgi:hypothetical protein
MKDKSFYKSFQQLRLLTWIWEMPFRFSVATPNIPAEIFRGQSQFPLDNSILTQFGLVGLSSELLATSLNETK